MTVFRVSAQGEPFPNTEELGKAGKAKSKTYSWTLNNTSLKYTGPLVSGYFYINTYFNLFSVLISIIIQLIDIIHWTKALRRSPIIFFVPIIFKNSSSKTKKFENYCTRIFPICTGNNANSNKSSSHIMATYVYDRVYVLIDHLSLLCEWYLSFYFIFFSSSLTLSFSLAVF